MGFAGPRAVWLASARDRAVEQREQLAVVALGGRLSVGGGVGDRVAVRGAGIDLRLVAHSGRVERALDLGDLLRRRAAVVVGEGEVDLGGQPVGALVWAVLA